MRKRCLACILFLFCCATLFAQQNLVLNGDFEDYKLCPDNINQIGYVDYWTSIDSNWILNADPPEYFNECAGSGSTTIAGAPETGQFFQYPLSGQGMAGLITYFVDGDNVFGSRNYLQGRLQKRLTPGKQYCVTFYVSLANYYSRYATKELGAYLDNGLIDTTKNPDRPQTRYTPQIQNSGGIIKDTMNWVKIQGAFTANGTEQFITIGNFNDNAHTTLDSFLITGRNSIGQSYYLLDDVSVVEINAKADAGPDTHVGLGDSVFIGTHDVALDCYWTKLGSSTVIGATPGIWVKPTVTTSYVLTLDVCGAITKDTVKVEVWDVGVHGIGARGKQRYRLSPNPAADAVTIRQQLSTNSPVSITLLDILGRKVYTQSLLFTDNTALLQLPKIAGGIYYVRIQDEAEGIFTLKLLKE